MGVIKIEWPIPKVYAPNGVSVPCEYRSGIWEWGAGTHATCTLCSFLHLLFIRFSKAKRLGPHSRDVTFIAISTGGSDFRPAKRGCQFRQPLFFWAMLDRWVFFGGATQSRAIKSQAHFSPSMGGLPLLHPFNLGRLQRVVRHPDLTEDCTRNLLAHSGLQRSHLLLRQARLSFRTLHLRAQ